MIEIIPNWHPVFVHFAIALVLTSLALYIGSFVMGEGGCRQQVQMIARWNLWFGAGASLLAVAAGIYAYNTVAHDTPSHAAMTEHRNWALATLVVVLQVAIWAWLRQKKGQAVNLAFLGAFVLGGFLMGSTAWHGGELVYRYGLGVMSLPKTDKHAHAPGEEHSHGSEGLGGSSGHGGSRHEGLMIDSAHSHDDAMADDHHSGDHSHSIDIGDMSSGDDHHHDHDHEH